MSYRLKTSKLIIGLLVTTGFLMFSGTGVTQELEPAPSDANIDNPVPESPAFTALGLTPQEVIRPLTPQDFGAQLLNGVDANGNLQIGLAMEVAPYPLLAGPTLTLERYSEEEGFSWLRTAFRTQLSLATAKGASDDDEAIRLGLGLRLTPWDEGDPRLDKKLVGCVLTAFQNVHTSDDYVEIEEEIFELKVAGATEEEIDKKRLKLKAITDLVMEECREGPVGDKARSESWNKSGWSLGFAPSFISKTGNTSDLEYNSTAFWTALAIRPGILGFEGLANTYQLLLSARYVPEEAVPNPKVEGAFIEQDTFVVAAQIRFAVSREGGSADGPPELILSVEGDYIYADRKDGFKDKTTFRVSLGADYKIPETKNTYLKFTIGGESGGDDDNQGFILGNLKVGF